MVPTFLAPFVDPMNFAKITGLNNFENSSNDSTSIDVETPNDPSLMSSNQDSTTLISNNPSQRIIPQGGCSTVREAKIDGKNVIIKQPKKEKIDNKNKQKKQAMDLAKEMFYLQHFKENNNSGISPIIKILGASFCYDNFLNSRLILERGEEDLSEHFEHNWRNLKLKDAIGKYIECAKAIQFVHSKKIAHLDIKNENFVLIEENNKIKIKVIV